MKVKRNANTFYFVALCTKDGEIIKDTIKENRDLCWEVGFWAVADREGEEWRQRYWKRWQPSVASAMGKGYRFKRMVCRPD